QAALLQVLRDVADSGHSSAVRAEVVERAAQLLDVDLSRTRERFEDAARELVARGHVVAENVNTTCIWFPAERYAADSRLAARLVEILATGAPALEGAEEAIAAFEARAGVALAPEQRSAVELAARAPALVVTGGPGVGKTTIVRAILAVFERAGLDVRLAAP